MPDGSKTDIFFDISFDFFCCIDSNYRFVRANPAFEKMLGFAAETLLSNSFFTFVHPDDQPTVRRVLAEALNSEGEKQFSCLFQGSRDKYHRLSWVAVQNPSNGLIYATAKDVTDFIANKELLGRVINNSPGTVYQFKMEPNKEMYFLYASPQICSICDITPEILEKDVSIAFSMVTEEDKGQLIQLIIESAQNLTQFEWTGRLVTPKGNLKWVKAKSIPCSSPDGSTIWDGIMIDISQEKIYEAELAKQRRISEHNAKLALVGELAAGVGHEINNPLTIITGYTHKLKRLIEEGRLQPEDVGTIAKKVLLSSGRIAQIVRGLRTFSRADDDELQKFDLVEAIEESLALITEIYKQDGIQLKLLACTEAKIFVFGSRGRLTQVIFNLLSNAKYAVSKKTHPVIEITIEQLPSGTARISVADNGDGIPDKVKDRIFEPFFTTKPVNEGTGIGLALCHSIVSEFGGRITFQSSQGSGSRFFIDIPIAVGFASVEQTSNLSEESGSSRRVSPRAEVRANSSHIGGAATTSASQVGGEIKTGLPKKGGQKQPFAYQALVADDETELCELLVEILNAHNIEVHTFSNGKDLLEALKEDPLKFQLVISDIKMPVMDGKELVKQIHALNLTKRPKLILTTGGVNVNLEASRTNSKSLIDGFILKPFSENDIIRVVDEALQPA